MIKKNTVQEISLKIPPFKLLSNSYMTPLIEIKKGKIKASWKKFNDLDEVLVNTELLSFDLSFPFNSKVSYTIYSAKKGFTTQFLIDEIRRSYRHLFRHSKTPALTWEKTIENGKEVEYQVLYPHSNLFVEDILINHKENKLRIVVEGFPLSFNIDDLPF